ncbi:DNA/RNA non-specific endonuclease [Brevibacillus sp. 179-C9.3 HS]|uniref:DNA/RNA non-specific endonuclease n=2 Tax=Brevibacillus TaxID=55080 RepID=UPI0039A31217
MMGGKELVLTAKESEEGNIFIKLHEEDGIEIHSMHPIAFSSEKDMEITSDTKIEIKAKEAIYLMCSTSSMILDGEVDLQAPKIEMVGLTKAPVVVEDLPQEEEEEEQQQEEQKEEEKSGWGGFLDGLQLGLDLVGLIPGLGEIADLANAGISAARGDYAGAALSLAACIPFAGWAATGAKLGVKAHKALKGTKAGQKVLEVADSAADVVKNVANTVETTVGKVWTAARKTLDEMDVMQAVQRIKEQLYASIMAAKEAVIAKATQMKEQLKQKARKLRDDMQESLQNLADSLGPQLQLAEGFPVKFSNKNDVVELAPTENQLKWRETYGGPNGQKPNRKPPEKPPEIDGSGNGPNKTFVDNPFDERGKLKPNVQYKAGEHKYDYETDHLGRIESFKTDDLKLTARDERLPHESNTPGKEPGDHAGHLAGDRFCVSPDIDNLVSQSSKVNLSTYKKIENEWARALKENPPKHVSVDVKVNYEGDSLRPSSFNVSYIIDGELKVFDLVN